MAKPHVYRVGDARVARVQDCVLDFFRPDQLLPEWREGHRRLSEQMPETWAAGGQHMLLSIHSWVVQHDGKTIIVDTGAGNGKVRPFARYFDLPIKSIFITIMRTHISLSGLALGLFLLTAGLPIQAHAASGIDTSADGAGNPLPLPFNVGGNPAMTLTATGLGIGTTNPIRPLTVNNGEMSLPYASNSNAYFDISDGTGSNGGNYSLILRGLASNGTATVNIGNLYVDSNTSLFTGEAGHPNLALQNSGQVTLCGASSYAGSDLGLYSACSGGWVRFQTNNGQFAWFADNAGSSSIMSLSPLGNLGVAGMITAAQINGTGEAVDLESYGFRAVEQQARLLAQKAQEPGLRKAEYLAVSLYFAPNVL